MLIATLAGVGRLPKAPGTIASFLTAPVAVGLALAGTVAYGFVTLAILLTSVPVCGRAADVLGVDDPPMVVLDEVAGMLIAYAPFAFLYAGNVSSSLPFLGLTFVFFRWLDIRKYGWIGKAQHLPGGVGIVMDDVMAGIGAAIAGVVCWWIASVAIPHPFF